MIRHAVNSSQTHLYLFYSNHCADSAVFLSYFQELEKKALDFRFIPTMTATCKSSHLWTGESGIISEKMLSDYLPTFKGAIWYVAGSPLFVEAMLKMLKFAGVAEEEIRCEEFVGY